MAFLTKDDKEVIQSMQTSDAELKEIEKAKKNKGVRSRGNVYTLEEYKKLRGGAILHSYDTDILEKNRKENAVILKDAGYADTDAEELLADNKKRKKKKKINPDTEEHTIGIEVCDDYCIVSVSSDKLPFYAEMCTRYGNPKEKKDYVGDHVWRLPCDNFTFGGRRYTVAKTKTPNYHSYTTVFWSNLNPDAVYIETSDTRWMNNIEKLQEKYGDYKPHHRRKVREDMSAEEINALPVSGRAQEVYEIAVYFPAVALDVPSKKRK